MNLRTALGRLRLMGLFEAVSWAFLLVSMALKYGPGLSEEMQSLGIRAVRVVGAIHGGLFMLYIAAVLHAWKVRKWKFERAILAALASIPPFGTVLFDVSLKREQQSTPL